MSRDPWAWLLRFYPRDFRREHGVEYLAFLRRQRREDRYRGRWGGVRFWLEVTWGAVRGGLAARASRWRRGAGGNQLPRAWRRLRRRPGLAGGVVLTLGLAMGLATGVFAVVEATLLAPLPYSTGERIVLVRNDVGVMEWFDRPVGRWIYQPLEEETPELFEAVTATRRARVNILLDGEPRSTFALRATADVFRVFDLRLALGRVFRPAEDRPGADRVAVLSHELWQTLFGSDPGAVGRTLRVDGVEREVIGVLPADVVLPGRDTDLVVPLAPDRTTPPPVGNHDHVVYGLLPAGVSVEEAESRMAAFDRSLRERYPGMELDRFEHRVHVAPLAEALTGEVRPTLLLLLGAGGLLFLLACANVSNLLLARAEARRMERSIRLSLGASRGSLGLEALAESILLALGGGALGLAVAGVVVAGVDRLPADLLPWTARSVELLGAPVLFALGTAAAAAILVGALPAVGVRRARAGHLLGAERGSGGRGRSRVRRGLVVSQVFLSVLLLTGAGLLGATLLELAGTDPGFRPGSVTAVEIQLPRADYGDPSRVADFGGALAERLRGEPGVAAAAVTDRIPLRDDFAPSALRIDGRDPGARGEVAPDAAFQVVTGDYFRTLGIPLLAGRAPRPGSPGVVVSRSFAERFLPAGRELEQRVALWAGDFLPVVGIVGDVRLAGLRHEPGPQIYYSMEGWADLVRKVDQWAGLYRGQAMPLGVVVRTRASTSPVQAVRSALMAVDPGIPVADARSLSQVVALDQARPRLAALVVGILALAGLLLAAIGTYGVLAHSVHARTRELGIRLALGATPASLSVRTALSGMGLALVGVAAGAAVAWAGAGVLDGILFGVDGEAPWIHLGVAVAVSVVALVASLGPAVRAARVDPVRSIRQE